MNTVAMGACLSHRRLADIALETMGSFVGDGCDGYLEALSESAPNQVRAAIVEAWEARHES